MTFSDATSTTGLGHLVAGDWDVAYVAAGPADGPLALLLHGFPDAPSTWRHLLPKLAAEGWRVVAPWMPGYGETRAIGDVGVHPRDLAEFVAGLHGAFGGDERAVVIGHDWGAVAVNQVTATRPELFRRAVTLAITSVDTGIVWPPDLPQIRRSWYAQVFQVPGAWRVVAARDWAFVDWLWRSWSPGHAPDGADRAGWTGALEHDGGRLAVAYYRALVVDLVTGRWPRDGEQVPKIPTLHLGGEKDGCFRPERQRAGIAGLPAGSRGEILAGVGHFLHLEAPTEVNERIVAWLEER